MSLALKNCIPYNFNSGLPMFNVIYAKIHTKLDLSEDNVHTDKSLTKINIPAGLTSYDPETHIFFISSI